jgi:hypothetical protein
MKHFCIVFLYPTANCNILHAIYSHVKWQSQIRIIQQFQTYQGKFPQIFKQFKGKFELICVESNINIGYIPVLSAGSPKAWKHKWVDSEVKWQFVVGY